MNWPPEVELRGEHAWLVPLRTETRSRRWPKPSAEGELWRIWYTNVPAPEDMAGEIDKRLAKQAAGDCLPFAVIDPATARAVGMTCYWNLDAEAKRVEIGATWYRRSVQRTPLNTECKRMLLAHAFETLDCIAVEFRTHILNQQSRRAIERLGARLDGILRNHIRAKRRLSLRDTCVYSIIASEWPAVRTPPGLATDEAEGVNCGGNRQERTADALQAKWWKHCWCWSRTPISERLDHPHARLNLRSGLSTRSCPRVTDGRDRP